jgi:hypothetical protein
VMNVATPHADVVKWSDVIVNRDCDTPNDDDRRKKTDGREEKPLAATFGKLLLVNRP